jgi:3,4-dihydroxy 2-butanone 4-phosphate synthase/GTP cyclohydrolase II
MIRAGSTFDPFSQEKEEKMMLASITQAIEEIRRGKMIILVDDENRENEGDLVMAAEMVTPEAVAFMAIHGRGLICLTLETEKISELKIPMMPSHNHTLFGAAFTVSVEAREGVTTGISAYDRAHTVKTLIAPGTGPQDWVSPGHLFPLRAQPGGVLERDGHTEASVDLARLAGLNPSGVICEIMKDDGTMARLPDLQQFADRHGLGLYSIEQLVAYMQAHQPVDVSAAEAGRSLAAQC